MHQRNVVKDVRKIAKTPCPVNCCGLALLDTLVGSQNTTWD